MSAVNIDLARLLHRMSARLLEKDAKPQLSSLELSKISTNLNYARKLLSQLETDASVIKNQAQRQRAQAEVMQQRHLVRKINETLHDLGRLDDHTVVHIEDTAPEPKLPSDSSNPPPPPVPSQDIPPDSSIPPSLPSSDQPTSVFRNRFRKAEPATTTKSVSTTENSSLEKALSNQRHQQDELTESLVQMAERLKLNSMSFGNSLEEEKQYLEKAAKGLDRNIDNMQNAKGRMSQLESSQSVTFWYQIKVLVAIVGLAFVGLLMLMAPKLRW